MGGKSIPSTYRVHPNQPEDIVSEPEGDDDVDNRSDASGGSTGATMGGDGMTQGMGLSDFLMDEFGALPLTRDDSVQVAVKVPGKEYTVSDIQRYVKCPDQKIRVKHLVWDVEGKYGQIRRLNHHLVQKYFNSLKSNGLPRNLVRIIVKEIDGM